MAWIDGLDIPLQYLTEAQFFEFGRDEISDAEQTTPERSRSERLWGYPGLRPLAASAQPGTPGTPLLAYRWEQTDRALADQLAIEQEGYGGTVEPGHAAVRYTDPATGQDVLPTIRVEFHRIATERRDRPGQGNRVERLHGLRRLRHRHRRRQDLVGGPRRPVRRPVLAAVLRQVGGRRHRLRLQARSTCSGSATPRSSRRSSSTAAKAARGDARRAAR